MDRKGKVNCPWSYQKKVLFQMAKNSLDARIDFNKKVQSQAEDFEKSKIAMN